MFSNRSSIAEDKCTLCLKCRNRKFYSLYTFVYKEHAAAPVQDMKILSEWLILFIVCFYLLTDGKLQTKAWNKLLLKSRLCHWHSFWIHTTLVGVCDGRTKLQCFLVNSQSAYTWRQLSCHRRPRHQNKCWGNLVLVILSLPSHLPC